MPERTRVEFKNHIEKEKLFRLYFIYGEDCYSTRLYTKKLLKRICGDTPSDFDFSVFDGESIDVAYLENLASTFPMENEYRCILINNLNFTALDKTSKDNFYDFVQSIPESCIVIISQPLVEVDGKSTHYKKIIKIAKDIGVLLELKFMTQTDMRKFIMNHASKYNSRISSKNAQMLIDYVGMDMNLVINELNKLCAYKTAGEIECEDIDKLCHKNLQTTVFLLAKSVIAGRLDDALSEVETLFQNKEQPVAVLGVLASLYVDIYRARVAEIMGIDTGTLVRKYANEYKGREFKLRNAMKSSTKFSNKQIKRSIDLLVQADEDLKSAAVDKKLVLQELIVKLATTIRRI